MFTAQDIWDSLYEMHQAGDDVAKMAQIRRETRKAYSELCRRTDWRTLDTELDYDLDVDADGIWMPPGLCGILGIGNDECRWQKSTKRAALKDALVVRSWYIDEVSFTPIASGADITMVSGATTFANPGGEITSDMVGEYIRFAGQDTAHRIASTTTIETPYYGDNLTGAGSFEVRPAGSQLLKLITPSGLSDTDNPVVYFWTLPSQLYVGTQLMLLPSSALIELAASIKLFTIERNTILADSAKKDLYGSKGRFEGELSRAESSNPEFIMPARPEAFHGSPAGWGSSNRKGTV